MIPYLRQDREEEVIVNARGDAVEVPFPEIGMALAGCAVQFASRNCRNTP